MKDEEHPSDYIEPKSSTLTSLPPEAKTAREISRGVKEMGIPILLLIGALCKIPHADQAFIGACGVSLLGHWVLRKAEGMPDWETVFARLMRK